MQNIDSVIATLLKTQLVKETWLSVSINIGCEATEHTMASSQANRFDLEIAGVPPK